MEQQIEAVSERRPNRAGALGRVVVGTLLFLVVLGIASTALGKVLGGHLTTLRGRTLLTLSGSALGEMLVLIALILFLRSRGRTLRWLGLWQPAPLVGWLSAFIVTALYVLLVFAGILRGGAARLGEMSAFHLYGSLLAACSAGFVEEIFFRGFVMTELKDAGFGRLVQVLASGLLFGFAHVGWGLLSPGHHAAVLIGSMVTTAVLGALYAVAYLASRRSLMPVIAGHFAMDLLIEPWLVLTTLAASSAVLRR
jgi:hypothetical protein